MARDEQQVGLDRLHLGERRGHVVDLGRQLVVDEDLHAVLLRLLDHALAHVEAEGIVLEGHGDLDVFGVSPVLLRHLGGEDDGVAQVVVCRREHREEVAVSLGEELAGGCVPLHVRHLVLLRHGRHGLGEPGAVRAEDELHTVLVDEPLGQLRAAGGRRFVVVVDDFQLVALARDLHAAHFIDALDRDVVAVLGVLAVDGVLPGERDGGAEHHGGVFPFGGDSSCGQHQDGREARCERRRHCLPSHAVSIQVTARAVYVGRTGKGIAMPVS